MAIRFMDGFDQYHSTNNTDISVALTRNYTIVNDNYLKCVTGRYGGMALTLTHNKNRTYFSKAISATGVARFIIGFNIKATSSYPMPYASFVITPSNAASAMYSVSTKGLTFCSNGQVYYNYGSAAQWDGGVQIVTNTWSHWEMVLPISPGVGNPTIIYKDGVQVYSSTNSASNFSWDGNLLIGSALYGSEYYMIDDLYVLDDTGSANNARITTSTYVPRIETLVPTSTVANDFTLTGVAAAHEALDNIPLNTSHYISSSTTGHKIRCSLGDLSNITNIKGVQFTGICSNATAANNDWKFLMNNTEVGTTKTVTDILQNSTPITQQIFDINPLTSSTWVVNDINSIETGIINK